LDGGRNPEVPRSKVLGSETGNPAVTCQPPWSGTLPCQRLPRATIVGTDVPHPLPDDPEPEANQQCAEL